MSNAPEKIFIYRRPYGELSRFWFEHDALYESIKYIRADKYKEMGTEVVRLRKQHDILLEAIKKLGGMKLNIIADDIIDKVIAEILADK